MSRILCCLLLLFLAACQNKNESSSQRPIPDYFKNEVGIVKNGSYAIVNLESVKGLWQNYVRQVLGAATAVELTDFRIVKPLEKASPAMEAECYMLVCRTREGFTKAAALLELKDGKFYFLKEAENAISYSVLVCTGNCATGCDPTVVDVDGKPLLNCSECIDCDKVVGEMGE